MAAQLFNRVLILKYSDAIGTSAEKIVHLGDCHELGCH